MLDSPRKSLKQLAEEAGLGTAWDSALPQAWWNDFHNITGFNPYGHIVWSYKDAGVFGEPVALTPEGFLKLEEYNNSRKVKNNA
jgi:hypothetical protein